MSMLSRLLVFLVALTPFCSTVASEQLAGIACRSVHLSYSAPEGTEFYNECTVQQSASGSYFAVCGFDMGYFGIQELTDGRKVVIFSVWEPGRQNDPQATPERHRVANVYAGEDVQIKRFGGEGTGGQAMFEYPWKLDTTYRFLVRAQRKGSRTEFAAYFFMPNQGVWKHLATFSTIARGKQIRNYYSFVEDFRRNGESTKKVRRARFSNGWIQESKGEWRPLDKARFTADGNPAINIDAGLEATSFFLATGGNTENASTTLGDVIRSPAEKRSRPRDLPLGHKSEVTVELDTEEVPHLKAWGKKAEQLIIQWYPRIVARLPTEGFVPPSTVRLRIRKSDKGIAAAAGNQITVSSHWIESHPDDIGLIVHELVHVIQSYPSPEPWWITEGIADYVRWVIYEQKDRNSFARPRKQNGYAQGYQVAAGFLWWLESGPAPGIVVKLNTAMRNREYSPDMFLELTGQSLDSLWNAYTETD